MDKRLSDLIAISREIASQRDYPELFRRVVVIGCRALKAEGGTFYLYDEKEHDLKAVVALNSKLKDLSYVLREYDPNDIQCAFAVPLQRGAEARQRSISGQCWKSGHPEYITDIASNRRYNLESVLKFDKDHGYTTRSILAVPIINKNEEVIGVLQLVNVSERLMHENNIEFVRAMSVLIGIALENNLLLIGMKTLLDSVVAMISAAIDARSKVTGGHSFRVTEVTMMIARAMVDDRAGPYRDFSMTEAELHELKTAALIHDVGKIATPDYVLEKGKKLEQVDDRIGYVGQRFVLRRLESRVRQLEEALAAQGLAVPPESAETSAETDDFDFVEALNTGGEFLTPEARARLEEIAARPCMDGPLIEEADLRNLSVGRGTLNDEERRIMEAHAQKSIDLLAHLPWPKHLANVPEIAGKHHENEDGSGYPRGLTGAQMSTAAKILSLADRFEGLSAPDRSYRKPKTLDEVMRILDFMRDDGHIDAELYAFFVERKLHETYARRYLTAAQLPPAVKRKAKPRPKAKGKAAKPRPPARAPRKKAPARAAAKERPRRAR